MSQISRGKLDLVYILSLSIIRIRYWNFFLYVPNQMQEAGSGIHTIWPDSGGMLAVKAIIGCKQNASESDWACLPGYFGGCTPASRTSVMS